MKQLGNLALVCAQRPATLLQIQDGIVAVFVGSGPEREVLSASWDDYADILRIIHELNFGKFRMSL